MTDRRRPSLPRAADIEFVASVAADELRFDEPPETDIQFFGEPGHESTSDSERTNVPEKVKPGVTYRNVRVDYRLASRLAEPSGRPGDQARGGRPNDARP